MGYLDKIMVHVQKTLYTTYELFVCVNIVSYLSPTIACFFGKRHQTVTMVTKHVVWKYIIITGDGLFIWLQLMTSQWNENFDVLSSVSLLLQKLLCASTNHWWKFWKETKVLHQNPFTFNTFTVVRMMMNWSVICYIWLT